MSHFRSIAGLTTLFLGIVSVILLGNIPGTEEGIKAFAIGIGIYGGGIGIFSWGFGRFKRLQLVKDTPTSKIRSMAMGTVEIKGEVAQLKDSLVTPFTGKDCIYYKYTVEEYRPDTDRNDDWELIDSGESRKPFGIEDGTGAAVVEPHKANIDIPVDETIKVEGSEKPPEKIKQFIQESKNIKEGSNEWISLIDNDRRYKEWYITPGEEVYVFGYAETERQEGTEFPVVRNGKAPMFYISDKSEQEIRKRWGWTYKAMILGGILATPLGYLVMAGVTGIL